MLATDAHREGRKKEDERGIYPSFTPSVSPERA